MADTRHLVAHVMYRFAVGGLENGVVNLINRLPEERFRHAVIALDGVCERFAGRVQRGDVEYVALHKGPGSLLRHYPRLAKLFRALAPAIVHTRNLAALEAAPPAWWAGVPVRIHGEHGWDARDPGGANLRYRRVRRLYVPFVHQYVAVSADLAGYLQRKVGVPATRIARIPNGVDVQRFAPPAPMAPRAQPPGLPFDADAWLVGAVGRLDPVKDHCTLVRAFALAIASAPEAARRMRLVIVGEGPAQEAVRATAAAAGVTHLTWFAGERSDIPDLLRRLDCFVLPSRAEGISNTLLEAMACGRCIVATAVGGNPELVEHDLSATLVPAQDPPAFGAAILRYFLDTACAARHAANARARAVATFSLERMVAQYEQLYLALLAGRQPDRQVRLAARAGPQA